MIRRFNPIFLAIMFCFLTWTPLVSYGQTVIGGTEIDSTAIFQLESTTKGFLPPRMTEVQMKAISKPAEGLVVYCTDCNPKGLYANALDGTNLFLFAANNNDLNDLTTGSTGDSFSNASDDVNTSYLSNNPPPVTTFTFNGVSSAYGGVYTILRNPSGSQITSKYGDFSISLGVGCYYINIYSNVPANPANDTVLWIAESGGSLIKAEVSSGWTSKRVDFCITSELFSQNADCADALISAGNKDNCTGTVVNTGNASYSVVEINGQCWMTSNLKTIPSNYGYYSPTSWTSAITEDFGFWGFYNSNQTDGSAGWGETEPTPGAGYLYQWSAAMNGANYERARGVCPKGWHIPSDCEWKYLEHSLGLPIENQNENYRSSSSNALNEMSDELRNTGNNAWNASYSGFRENAAGFYNFSNDGYYWSSTRTDQSTAYIRQISNFSGSGVERYEVPIDWAISVRCIKD